MADLKTTMTNLGIAARMNLKIGSKVEIIREGDHDLRVGAQAVIRDLRADGYAMLTIGGVATAFAPFECLRVIGGDSSNVKRGEG